MDSKKSVLLEVFKRNERKFLTANAIFFEAQKITGQHNLPFKGVNSLTRCLGKFHYTRKSPNKTNFPTGYYCPTKAELKAWGVKVD
ncbi:MAG: hypothetical protein COV47_05870 [Candidatus Diapherotrites archaeon CG11_big_fil_rev_8_21_14_0_20_37_9]|nr:MAG: hypothetical protein COV47_05870 [Candidatus Diapherotrites archaeon CG11_big_fil_rev_8_21_14_0_20_37_9]